MFSLEPGSTVCSVQLLKPPKLLCYIAARSHRVNKGQELSRSSDPINEWITLHNVLKTFATCDIREIIQMCTQYRLKVIAVIGKDPTVLKIFQDNPLDDIAKEWQKLFSGQKDKVRPFSS